MRHHGAPPRLFGEAVARVGSGRGRLFTATWIMAKHSENTRRRTIEAQDKGLIKTLEGAKQ